jgi:putative glutamine amidotransferase
MGHGQFYRYALSRTYVDAIRAAGGVPVILPTDSLDLDDVLPRLNGLLISGGGDIDPALYGDQVVHETTYGIDHERDAFEIKAYQYAANADLPTLCICRGIQVMAVAAGGTLFQDIGSSVPNAMEHRQHNLGKMRDELGHEVTIAGGNPLHDLIGQDHMMVNSFHHQSVLDPGPSLRVIATASDGVIEALWHPEMRFGLGVQWHPEMLAQEHQQYADIFAAFVGEARN